MVPGPESPTDEDRDMKQSDDDLRQAIALFRYGVIADLVHLPVGTPGTGATMRAKAERSYAIPGSNRTRVAAETMRGWIADYRRGGFEALYPKPRTDRGKPRRLPAEIAERLIALKAGNPGWSVRIVIEAARREGVDHPLAPSTVHRLLAREGLFDGKPPNDGADRRRFAFRDAGELWMSDVMHGPKVRIGRTRRKTYLIAFIDDATRVVPFAAFATAENVRAFLPTFRNALIRRGLPQRLYVDNGAAYRSRQLALVCARLGVALIHARPYQPAGKGKIERFFRTVRAGWLGRVEAAERETLETLNRSLWAWIEGEYHNSAHRGLEGRTPLEQWALASAGVRYPDATLDLDDIFLFEATRVVHKDRTVSLDGRLYEVDALLVGQRVVLRYDPDAPPGRPLDVVHDGKPAGQATRLDAYANTAVKRGHYSKQIEPGDPPPEPPPSPLRMRNFRKRDD